MLQQIFYDLTEISIAVSFVILLDCAASKWMSKTYGRRFRKILWLVLAIRLLIPWNYTLEQTPVKLFQTKETIGIHVDSHELSEKNIMQEEADAGIDEKDLNAGRSQRDIEEVSGTTKDGIPILVVAALVWFMGVCVYFGRQLWIYLGLRRRCRKKGILCGGVYERMLRRTFADMKIRRIPRIYRMMEIQSPMILGYFDVIMLLPDRIYTEEQLEHIFRHEGWHYRCKDLWYKLLMVIVCGLHWFNPCVYYMRRQSFEDLEFVCDEKTTSMLKKEEKKSYCHTLLDTTISDQREQLLSTCFWGSKRILKYRINNIFDETKKKSGKLPLILILGVMILLSMTISCGYQRSGAEYDNMDLSYIADTKKSRLKDTNKNICVMLEKIQKEDGIAAMEFYIRSEGTASLGENAYFETCRCYVDDVLIHEKRIGMEETENLKESFMMLRTEHAAFEDLDGVQMRMEFENLVSDSGAVYEGVWDLNWAMKVLEEADTYYLKENAYDGFTVDFVRVTQDTLSVHATSKTVLRNISQAMLLLEVAQVEYKNGAHSNLKEISYVLSEDGKEVVLSGILNNPQPDKKLLSITLANDRKKNILLEDSAN